MLQLLQVLQIILFITPILVLLALGVLTLVKPVSVINRRWFLLVFLPFLLANTLAIIENNLTQNLNLISDWRFWLILAADVGLLVWALLVFRGFMVHGLSASETVDVIKDVLKRQGIVAEATLEEKHPFWTDPAEVCVVTIHHHGQEETIWILEKFNEVRIRAGSKCGFAFLKPALAVLRRTEKPYDFSAHAMGILYIVLALVLAVFGWIFFFEPRLILIE